MPNPVIERIQKNDVARFLAKGLFLAALVLVLDTSTGAVLRSLFQKHCAAEPDPTTYALERTTDDILVIGSSRARHHYRPDIIAAALNESCFNIGHDGSFLLNDAAIVAATLKRYAPKLVIVDVLRDELEDVPERIDRLRSLLPYYQTHAEIRPFVDLKSRFESVKCLSNIYPYNSMLIDLAENAGTAHRDSASLAGTAADPARGYIPLYRTWAPQRNVKKHGEPGLNPVEVQVFRQCLSMCRDAHIHMLVVISPYYASDSVSASATTMQAIAKESGVPFLDLSTSAQFTGHQELFADPVHLNDRGAKVFTTILVDSMKAYMDRKVL